MVLRGVGFLKSRQRASCIVFLSFPFIDLFRSSDPCSVVLQVVNLCCLSFFIFHKLVQLIFPSLGWSSCFSLRSRRYDKSRIPLSGFSGPSVWLWVAIRRACRHFCFCCVSTQFVMLCVSIFSRFSLCTQSGLLLHLLGLMCYPHHLRM